MLPPIIKFKLEESPRHRDARPEEQVLLHGGGSEERSELESNPRADCEAALEGG